MADGHSRAALEDTQMELRRLKAELAAWPAVSRERVALGNEVSALEGKRATARARLAEHNRREVAERDMLSRRSGVPWWSSPWLMGTAISCAVIAGIRVAWWSLEVINWT